MSDDTPQQGPQLEIVDRAWLLECVGWPERQEPPNNLEYTAAEFWIRDQFTKWFRRNRGSPQIITWQLARFFEGYETGDPVLELAMKILEGDFRNTFSDRFCRQFFALLRGGKTPPSELLKLLKEASPGGALKPDMLGISAEGNTLSFEAIEVGTVKTAQSTYFELNKKLDLLRSVVIPNIKLEIPSLLREYANRMTGVSLPTDFSATGSAFRPDPFSYVLPLPVRISESGVDRFADWICFHPSKTLTPASDRAQNRDPSARGIDGLFTYHIHRAALPNLPSSIRKHVERELQKWRESRGWILQLDPAFARTLQSSKSDWSPEARQLFFYLGAGALVVCFVLVAWELGLIAGGAALAGEGLTALTSSPATLISALRGASEIAPLVWPAAQGAVSLMPASAY